MFSQTYASVIVIVLAQLLPKLGVEIGSDQLTTTITTILTIVGALWVLIRRHRAGDVTLFGRRKA